MFVEGKVESVGVGQEIKQGGTQKNSDSILLNNLSVARSPLPGSAGSSETPAKREPASPARESSLDNRSINAHCPLRGELSGFTGKQLLVFSRSAQLLMEARHRCTCPFMCDRKHRDETARPSRQTGDEPNCMCLFENRATLVCCVRNLLAEGGTVRQSSRNECDLVATL